MPALAMDRPPLPSPDIQGQMGMVQNPPAGAGGGGLASMTQKIQDQQQAGAPGVTQPKAALRTQAEAVKAVLAQMAGLDPVFAPFAQKCVQLIESGISAALAVTGLGGEGTPPEVPSTPATGATGGGMPALA